MKFKQWWNSKKIERTIAYRFLRTNVNSKYLSLITWISFIGVAIGVFTLIVTLSVMSGFEKELKKRLFQADTHILIEYKNQFFEKDEDLLSKLKDLNKNIKDIFPVLETESVLRAGRKVLGVQIKGVEQNELNWVKTLLTESNENLESRLPKLYVGQELAFSLGLIPGDEVSIVSPIETEGPLGAIPKIKNFVVAGVYKSGVPEQELQSVFTSLENVQDFLGVNSKFISKIEIKTDSFDSVESVAKSIKNLLNKEEYTVRSWQELNAHLFYSLKLERIAMFSILLIIIIVASFNIVSNLSMMVVEKKNSLSILRTMGASSNFISSIFIWQGILIGFFGSLIGVTGAMLVSYFLSHYPIIELPAYYYDRTLPVVIDVWAIIIVMISTWIIVLFASKIPSQKASEIQPIDGLSQG